MVEPGGVGGFFGVPGKGGAGFRVLNLDSSAAPAGALAYYFSTYA